MFKRRSFLAFVLLTLVVSFASPTVAQDALTAQKGASNGQATKNQGGKTDLTFNEQLALAAVPVVITAILGLAGTIIAPIITYKLLTRDRSPKFHRLDTGNINIHNTDWYGIYTDNDPQRSQRDGSIHFEQYGNRLVGKGNVPSQHRTWTIEGVISNRRVCYIYHDDDPNKVSFGTAMMQVDGTGHTLTGVWNGWSPDGKQFSDLPVTLERR